MYQHCPLLTLATVLYSGLTGWLLVHGAWLLASVYGVVALALAGWLICALFAIDDAVID